MIGKFLKSLVGAEAKELIKESKKQREETEERLDKLKASLNGENGWGLCLTKNGVVCEGSTEGE